MLEGLDELREDIDTVVYDNIIDCVEDAQFMNIIHFNIRSLRKNFDNLLVYLSDLKLENVDIILLSETRSLEQVSDFCIPGFTMYFNMSFFNQNDGFVVYVRDELSASNEIVNLTETNLLRITLKINDLSLGITGSYRSPPTNIRQYITDLDSYFSTLTKKKLEMFVGDININILGDSTSLDSLTYQMMMTRHGFISYINKPTRVAENSNTLIDHLFVRVGDKHLLREHIVLKSFLFTLDMTDHFPIGIAIKHTNKVKNNRCKQTFNYREKVDYNRLVSLLQKEDWLEVFESDEVQDSYDIFNSKLKNHITKSTKQFKYKIFKNKKVRPWITNGIINSIKYRDKLKRKLLKANTLENKTSYNQYRNLLNKIIKKVKNDYYKTKLKESQRNFKKIWKTINEVTNIGEESKNKLCVNLVSEDGVLLENDREKVEAFNNFFVNIGKRMQTSKSANLPLKDPFPDDIVVYDSIFLNPITYNEVIKHISTLKNDSSPGPDGVSVAFIKTYHSYILKPLCYIFNLCLEKGKIPQSWKDSVVTPIFKSGSKKELTNYRPISVINNFAKLYEKCLKQRLVGFLQKHKVISKQQYGFQEQLDTSDAATKLIQNVVYSMNDNKKCLAVFLDLAKAFDTVDHRLLMRRLERNGIRGSAFKVFSDYLTNRRQKVKLNNTESDYQVINTGIPQGTVLGPILFLLYINNLYKSIDGKGELISYADDTALVFQGNSWNDTYKSAEMGLQKVQAYLSQSLLSLNIKKTQFVAFSLTDGDQPSRGEIKIHHSTCEVSRDCGCPVITKVKNIKYLGLFLDCHLRWTGHVDYLVNRLKQLTYKFYQLRDILDAHVLKIVYVSLAESIIRYCIVIWGGLYENALGALAVMQNTILKILFKKDALYSTRLLYSELNIFNIRKLYIYETLLWTFKNGETIQHVDYEVGCNTRAMTDRAMLVPLFRKSHLQRFVFYYGPKIYNCLPQNIRNVATKTAFKKYIKQYVDENYDEIKNLFK